MFGWAVRLNRLLVILGSLRNVMIQALPIMNERLEITLQVAIDGSTNLKLIFVFWP
jgi:hypothetical protein